MYKKKFFFIVFEGIEGTGKSFQINKLFKNLKRRKVEVIKTREPGGSLNAEKIRNLLFNKHSLSFDKLTDFYLMLASRNEHLKSTLLKAKINKTIVLCDRFIDSTYAYQVVGHGISKNLNRLNNNYIVGKMKPDLTIVLKAKINIIKSRIKKRKTKNRLDKLKINFYKKAQNAFIKLSKIKKNYYLFDSSPNDAYLEKKIANLIFRKLKIK